MPLTKFEKYQALLGYVGRDEQELAAFLYVRGSHNDPPLSLEDSYLMAHELVEFLDQEMQQAQRDESVEG